MSCFDNYITLDSSTPSRSGLYARDLPGIDGDMLDGLAKGITGTPDEDRDDIWPVIYKRAYRNLISDAQKLLQSKFHSNLKLTTRETSEFQDDANSGSGLAGLTIEFSLPKYARVHIISIGVFSETSYAAANAFRIYDTDESGELLATINTALSSGRNTVNVDRDFDADKLFISYNTADYLFRKTENKFFNDINYLGEFGSVVCDQCFYGDPEFTASIVQINNGGVNVKFLIYCSFEKYVCENIKLFEDALLYKIGHEITRERRYGERLNQYTEMTVDRWAELEKIYLGEYEVKLMNTIDGTNIPEDDMCFACRNTVRTDTLLP